MTNNLNGTPLLLKTYITFKITLYWDCFMLTIQCPRFGYSLCVLYRIIEFVIPEPQKAKLCFLLRGSVCVVSLSTLPPCQHRTWYQIWHGKAKRQHAYKQMSKSFLVCDPNPCTRKQKERSHSKTRRPILFSFLSLIFVFLIFWSGRGI